MTDVIDVPYNESENSKEQVRNEIAFKLTTQLFEEVQGKEISISDIYQILDSIKYNVENTPLS